MSEWPRHGGQPKQLLAQLGLADSEGILDFSANINPLGPPAWLKDRLADELVMLHRYPDPDYRYARRAIAEAEGLAPGQVLLTNGGAEAVFLAAALHAGQSAALVQPTFGEYARACRHYRLTTRDIFLVQKGGDFILNEAQALDAMARADVVFLCRPNNPSGTLAERRLIERMLAAGLRSRACYGSRLVVDEAFIDFVDEPDESLVPLLATYPNLLILRSLTKMYAIPGLRLGYLLGSPDLVACAGDLQMPWSVNTLAAALTAPLLDDTAFVARTRDWLHRELPRLQGALQRLGFSLSSSRANFYLLQDRRCPDLAGSDALLRFLAQAGILARHTHNFRGLDGAWLRLAVRSQADNDRLLDALKAWRVQQEARS